MVGMKSGFYDGNHETSLSNHRHNIDFYFRIPLSSSQLKDELSISKQSEEVIETALSTFQKPSKTLQTIPTENLYLVANALTSPGSRYHIIHLSVNMTFQKSIYIYCVDQLIQLMRRFEFKGWYTVSKRFIMHHNDDLSTFGA